MNYELFSHTPTDKKVYLIDMTREHGYFSEMLTKGLAKYIKAGKRILCIVNKKGFASGLLCMHCGHIPQCSQCSVSIGYHDINGSMIGLCHICKHTYELAHQCLSCKSADSLKLYGLTIQKTQQRISESFGISSLIIDAKVVSSQNKIARILPEFTTSQVVIGTNILADAGPGFDLTVLLAADQSLSIPDYSVRQHTFFNIHSVISKSSAQTILVQSYDTKHDSIRYACKGDETGFLIQEKLFREPHYYPPYGELCVIKYNNENETSLHNSIQSLTKELLYLQQHYQYHTLHIYSTPPLVYKKFGKFYYHIIILGPLGQVRPFMDICFSKLQMRKRHFKIDRMADKIV